MREKPGEQRKRISVSGFYPSPIRGVKSDRLLEGTHLTAHHRPPAETLSPVRKVGSSEITCFRMELFVIYAGFFIINARMMGCADRHSQDPFIAAHLAPLVGQTVRRS